MRERWKAIQGYEGLYQVSNYGRVRSLDRVITLKHHTQGVAHRLVKGQDYKQQRAGAYMRVTLRDGSKRKPKCVGVHRLVAIAFVDNPRPDEFDLVCHRDGNGTNNRWDNLRWGDHHTNALDRITHGTMRSGSDHQWAVLTDPDVISIREQYSSGGVTLKMLGAQYNVHFATIHMIVTGKTWKHLL